MKNVHLKKLFVDLFLGIHLFDVNTGKPISPVKHHIEVLEVALSKSGGRQLVVLDRNRDLWITGLVNVQFKKLGI